MYIFIVSPYKEVENLEKKIFLEERLSRLYKRLGRANLLKHNKIKIIGVDGENYDPKLDSYLSDNWRKYYLRFLTGSKGGGLSHIKIFKYIQEKNIKENVLIIEDDALIHSNFISFIPKEFPKDYDVLTMHCNNYDNYKLQNVIYSENIKKITNYNLPSPFEVHTYFINGNNISKILDSILPLQWQIDPCLISNPKLNNYIFNPELKLSGQETVHDNSWHVDSYSKVLNNYSKYMFLGFVNLREDFQKIDDKFIFEILCHCTMLHGINISNAYEFSLQERNNESKIADVKFVYDFYDKVLDQEYQKIYLKIQNPEILKPGHEYKLTVKYTEGVVRECQKSITNSKYFTYGLTLD